MEAILDDQTLVTIAAEAGLSPIPRKSACFFCPSATTDDIRDLVDNHPALADRIIEMERLAKPGLRVIEGLWRRRRKGARGTEARPGSMTEFIEEYRAKGRLPVLVPLRNGARPPAGELLPAVHR